jgi:hypothetical protein
MRVRSFLIAASAVLAVVGFCAAVLATGAAAHSNPCHTQHICPSDHHTYVWTDLTTGLQWDCAESGASEYDPSRDTTTIVYAGLTYYCRTAGSTTTTTTTTTVSTTTLPTTATEPTSTQTTTTTTTTTTTPIPTLVLPIKSLTPGAVNRSVRQGTIGRTVCKLGWTRTVRPSVRYTNALKLKQMPLYEETGPRPRMRRIT